MPHFYRLLIPVLPLTLMTGCALNDPATLHGPAPGPAVSGVAFGGSQPIVGAKVYLLAANPGGYGSASLSLLTTASTGNAVDGVGAYVTTAAGTGGFNLAPAGNADYDCTQGYALGANTSTATPTSLVGNEQVYLYIKGGDSGSGTNNNIGLLAALGPCNNIYSNTITVNELTTIAAAYALSGYATDASHLASSGSAPALTGLSNAGLNSANLVNLASGLPVTNSTGITRPVSTLYTLGDILAACVNGMSGNTNCSTLFTYTQSSGASGGTPADMATAAINLAHNPWPSDAGMTALYGLIPATGAPFAGGLSKQPNDFTLSLTYTVGTVGGLIYPYGIAIDASGNAWTANQGNGGSSSISKFTSTGAALSPSSGYTGGGLSKPSDIAIDNSGYVWTANSSNNSISMFSSAGAPVSSSTGITGGGLSSPTAIAIDASGYVWVANYGANAVSKFSGTGSVVSPSTGYQGGGLNQSEGIAIDGSGSAWISNNGNTSLSEFANNGTATSGSNGDTGGGLNIPRRVAVDPSGNIWVADQGGGLSKFSNTGIAISPSSGFRGGGLASPTGIAIDSAGNAWVANNAMLSSVSKFSNAGIAISPPGGYTSAGLTVPNSVAIDASGDVWAVGGGSGAGSVTELIGAASPVVTPIVANLISPYSAPASRP
jgi:DNA-binding beta-propeller fold protein YncE